MSGSWEPFGRTPAPDQPAAPAPVPGTPPAGSPGPGAHLDRRPRRALAVVTCMDSRLDPLRDLGLERGDAMVLRNAGATLSEDIERSLRVAHEGLGVDEVWLVGHTDCVAHGCQESQVRAALRDGVRRVHGTLPGFKVRTLLYDLTTGRADPVE